MQASDYTQVIGIILGMCMMGYVGDTIGRKWGSVTTAVIMFIGGIMLTCLDGVNEKGLAIMYIVAQFVFGFGVGGEYPMAAGSAAERAEAGGKAKAKKRGREVLLTFSMQVSLLLLTCWQPSMVMSIDQLFSWSLTNGAQMRFPWSRQLLSAKGSDISAAEALSSAVCQAASNVLLFNWGFLEIADSAELRQNSGWLCNELWDAHCCHQIHCKASMRI